LNFKIKREDKMKKKEIKKVSNAKKAISRIKKEIKEANVAIKKAKKEIKEAEAAIEHAQNEAFDVAEMAKGKKKIGFTSAVRDLEKAADLAIESSESTEEAEFKLKPYRKKK
jgi:septal ring factor EnvC (AmiA/AmiB activator)